MGYSIDLRKRAVAYRQEGHTIAETSRVFGIGTDTLSRWMKQYRETGDLSPKPLNRTFKKIDPVKLKKVVKEHPDAMLQEIAEQFGCSAEAVRKALKRNHITLKKKTLFYKEQNKEKAEEYLEKIKNIPPEEMNYIDETGFQKFLHREYAYAPRGEKVYDSISGKKFRRTNIVAAKRGNSIIAPLQYDGTMNGMLFETWFEYSLIPELSENSVIVMDNASFHRKKKLCAIAENHHMILIFLPPYSPELNPIEKEWANLKKWLKYNLHRFETLDDAISSYFQVE